MPGLTNDQIKTLLAIDANKKRGRPGGGGRTGAGKKVDTSVRDFQTWFRLMHLIYDSDTNDIAVCANPNCVDSREEGKGKIVAEVNGTKMCRYCFLSGWLSNNEDQQQLTADTND